MFNAAFSADFADMFGYLEEDGKEEKKEKWVYLAQVLEVEDIPETVTQFKKVSVRAVRRRKCSESERVEERRVKTDVSEM